MPASRPPGQLSPPPADRRPRVAGTAGATVPDSEPAESYSQRAQKLWEQGQLAQARASFARAVYLDPSQSRYWRQLDHALAGTVADQISERLRCCLWDAIEGQRLDPAELPNVVYSFSCSQPTLRRWMQLRRAAALLPELERWREPDRQPDPELFRMLRLVRLLGVEPELAVHQVRSWLLTAALTVGQRPPSPVMSPLAGAISHPCFLSDYAYYCSAEEESQVLALRAELVGLDPATLRQESRWFQLAVLACFEPLSQLQNRELILHTLAEETRADRAQLLQLQLVEPLREESLRAQIEQVGTIDDPISQVVQAQYEASPFPRWQTLPKALAEPGDGGQLALIPELLQHPAPRILVAGCGTGKHPITTAMSYPHAEVLAIDLSLASLAYAERKRRELGLRNLRFVRADLLQAGGLAQTFDAIESMGVLHHLADPLRGLRALLAVLAPQGWLRLGLYSAIARREITALRQKIAAAAIGPTPQALRGYRWQVLHSQHDPRSRWVATVPDFYNLHECRDLLFHAQEHLFTLPALDDTLNSLGLAFRRFELPSEVPFARYRRMFPKDAAMTNLQNWAELEARYPDTFLGMYQLWAQRRSEPATASSADLPRAE